MTIVYFVLVCHQWPAQRPLAQDTVHLVLSLRSRLEESFHGLLLQTSTCLRLNGTHQCEAGKAGRMLCSNARSRTLEKVDYREYLRANFMLATLDPETDFGMEDVATPVCISGFQRMVVPHLRGTVASKIKSSYRCCRRHRNRSAVCFTDTVCCVLLQKELLRQNSLRFREPLQEEVTKGAKGNGKSCYGKAGKAASGQAPSPTSRGGCIPAFVPRPPSLRRRTWTVPRNHMNGVSLCRGLPPKA